jgi:hypothetical protein
MRKLTVLFLSFFFTVSGLAKTVTMDVASIVADNYFSNHNRTVTRTVVNSFSVDYEGITVYHVFNYEGGGFVVVAADDAVTPILAQSNEGYIDREIANPAAKYWFDSYSKEIAQIISSNADNTETLKLWNNIFKNESRQSFTETGPLLTTTWDQTQWYNYYCPENPYIPGAHVPTGCVATAMGQIMKYHNFPAQGVLSHSYVNENFGIQTADFGNTTYNWDSIGSIANSSNYKYISKLLYHAGVSVDMEYDLGSSGARCEFVPWALTNYFNYDPLTIGTAPKYNYTDIEWKEMLKAELNASRPVFYRGNDSVGSPGHAWVCDGWRSGDDMFHMNWGWSGAADGWFTIGELNPAFNDFNEDNIVVKGIKPGNPDIIVRITNIKPSQVIGYGPVVGIDCSVIKGTPDLINLYLDTKLIYSSTLPNFTYNLVTTDYTKGVHILKLEALNAADTGYHEVTVANFGWVPQASAFTRKHRAIQSIHVVDSLIVWATAANGDNPTRPVQEFTRTKNGGETWTTGIINDCDHTIPAMIFALNADTAFCPMFMPSGSGQQCIYVTRNGGISWTRKFNAWFSNAASFPNVIHFFNKNEGFCMGDPVDGEFEIYIVSDGGYNWWIRVAAENIPDPETGENGIISYCSAAGNKAWFGTTKGRVYRTSDKGLHWDVSTTTLAGKEVDVEFANQFHGLAQDRSADTKGALSETFDGGITWSAVSITGQVGTHDLCYVPGTDNTWVSTGAGAAKGAFYSYDGGHSWARFAGTEAFQFLAVDFISKSNGWAGGFNESSTRGGVFKFLGEFPRKSPLSPVSNLFATVTGRQISLSWTAPVNNDGKGYNVFRNDTLLNLVPLVNSTYTDNPVATGKQTYCVKVVYPAGESDAVCTDALVMLGIPENRILVNVYPNPATELINIETAIEFSQVNIFNILGQEVYSCRTQGKNLKILTEGFKHGVYVLQIIFENSRISRKITVM